MATPSSPSEPAASSSQPTTARPQWRAKVSPAVMPSNTMLESADQDVHGDPADRDELPARRGAHMTEGERRAAQQAFDAARRTATTAATDAVPRRSVPSANLSRESHRAEPRPPAWPNLAALPADAVPDSHVGKLKYLHEQLAVAGGQLSQYPPNQIYSMFEKLPFHIHDLQGLPKEARTARNWRYFYCRNELERKIT